MRYRDLVSSPAETLDRMSRFLGIAEGRVTSVPPVNSRPFVDRGPKTAVLGRAIRLGAALQAGGEPRPPRLQPEQRTALLDACSDDIDQLEEVLGDSFADWRSAQGRGSFTERTAAS